MQHSRRSVLRALAVGAAAAAVPAAMRPRSASAHDPRTAAAAPDGAPAPPPWDLLAPLGPGDPLALGWRVETLSEIRSGAAVLVLAHDDGSRARILLCRNGGSPRGITHTHAVDLLVMNGARGNRPTDESLGRVVLGLADVIAANEEKAGIPDEVITHLMTHDERVRLHGSAPGGALA
jgi:hypothetical protein